MPEDAKMAVMIEMKDQVVRHFSGRNDFEYVENYNFKGSKIKAYLYLMTASSHVSMGDFYWDGRIHHPRCIGHKALMEEIERSWQK